MQEPLKTHETENDEFYLIELIIPIFHHIKLLILAPVLVALCSWVYTMNQSLVYDSTSLLRLHSSLIRNARSPKDFSAQQNFQYESALLEMTSSDVLATLQESPEVANLMKSKGLVGEAAYGYLRDQITIVFDKKAMLIKLTTRASDADTARILNQKLVESFVKFSLPHGHELELIEAQILQTKLSVKLLEEEIAKNNLNKSDARANSDLIIQLITKLERLEELLSQAKGFGSEIFVQRPSTPQSGVRPQQEKIVFLFSSLTLILILILILIRSAWRNFSEEPKNIEKINDILRRLGSAG